MSIFMDLLKIEEIEGSYAEKLLYCCLALSRFCFITIVELMIFSLVFKSGYFMEESYLLITFTVF